MSPTDVKDGRFESLKKPTPTHVPNTNFDSWMYSTLCVRVYLPTSGFLEFKHNRF